METTAPINEEFRVVEGAEGPRERAVACESDRTAAEGTARDWLEMKARDN